MSLTYRILIKENINLNSLIKNLIKDLFLINNYKSDLYKNQCIIDLRDSLGFILNYHNKDDFYEIQDGYKFEFKQAISIYDLRRDSDQIISNTKTNLIKVFIYLLDKIDTDLVILFDTGLIIAMQNNNKILLNKIGKFWDIQFLERIKKEYEFKIFNIY